MYYNSTKYQYHRTVSHQLPTVMELKEVPVLAVIVAMLVVAANAAISSKQLIDMTTKCEEYEHGQFGGVGSAADQERWKHDEWMCWSNRGNEARKMLREMADQQGKTLPQWLKEHPSATEIVDGEYVLKVESWKDHSRVSIPLEIYASETPKAQQNKRSDADVPDGDMADEVKRFRHKIQNG